MKGQGTNKWGTNLGPKKEYIHSLMVSLWNSLPCVQDDERQSQFSGEQLLVKDKQEMLCSSAQLDELAAGHKSVARRLKKKFLPQVAWIEGYVLHKCLKRQEKPMPVHWELSPSLFHERHKEFLRISIGWVLTQFYVVEPLVSLWLWHLLQLKDEELPSGSKAGDEFSVVAFAWSI